jgi:hypothetical protein
MGPVTSASRPKRQSLRRAVPRVAELSRALADLSRLLSVPLVLRAAPLPFHAALTPVSTPVPQGITEARLGLVRPGHSEAPFRRDDPKRRYADRRARATSRYRVALQPQQPTTASTCRPMGKRARAQSGSVVVVAREKRSLSEHEERTIRAFVAQDRQDRELLRLARGNFDSAAWAHRPPLDAAAMWQVPVGWSADQLLEELRQRGAPDTAVGIYGQLAGQTVPLPEALRSVFAARYGDLISLLPGRLPLSVIVQGASARREALLAGVRSALTRSRAEWPAGLPGACGIAADFGGIGQDAYRSDL